MLRRRDGVLGVLGRDLSPNAMGGTVSTCSVADAGPSSGRGDSICVGISESVGDASGCGREREPLRDKTTSVGESSDSTSRKLASIPS